MKFATYKNAQRDGELMLVSRDLTRAVSAAPVAQTLQQFIDNWDALEAQMQSRYEKLNSGEIECEAFDRRI